MILSDSAHSTTTFWTSFTANPYYSVISCALWTDYTTIWASIPTDNFTLYYSFASSTFLAKQLAPKQNTHLFILPPPVPKRELYNEQAWN